MHAILNTLEQLSGFRDWKLPLEDRLEFFRLGSVRVLVRWLEKEASHEGFCDLLWAVMLTMSSRLDLDDAGEEETAILVAKVNEWYPVACAEYERRPLRLDAVFSLSNFLVSQALAPQSAALMAQNGLAGPIVSAVKEMGTTEEGSLTLSVLRSLSQHPATHRALNEAHALEAALPFIRLLGSNVETDVNLGLRAASLVCRLNGKDETGPGADAIQANPLVVTKMIWFFDGVIAAGPTGDFLGGKTNPGNVAYDLYVLATSDKSAFLLAALLYQAG